MTSNLQASYQGHWQLPDPDAERRARRRRLATLCAAISLIIIASAIVAATFTHRAELDVRGCRSDQRPANAVELLIDQSDPFPPDLLAFVEDEVRRRTDQLRPGDLLSVSRLGRSDEGQLVQELFSRCRPVEGKDVTRWVDNPARRDIDYREGFKAPLEAAVSQALVPTAANRSPLLEALHTIAQRPAFTEGGRGRNLILFSDALQNSVLGSFFTRGYRFKQLRQRDSVYLADLRDHYAGTCVEMYVVTARYPEQTAWPELEAFWREYWSAAGVECLTWKRI